MSAEPVIPRSRRSLLGAAFAAAGAIVANAIGRPAAVEASPGQAVTLGGFFTAPGAATSIESTGNISVWAGYVYGTEPAFVGYHGSFLGTDLPGSGVKGISACSTGFGVVAQNTATSGQAVGSLARSSSPAGIGLWGETTSGGSTENYGVFGLTHSSLGRAVFGWNQSTGGGSGVFGQTNAGTGAAVRGYAWDSEAPTGSFGTGVIGTSGSHDFPPPAARKNTGVMGVSPIGTGGYFSSSSGTALQAVSTAAASYALKTSGRLSFAKVSGVTAIASGSTGSLAISPGTDLTATSFVLLTPRSNIGSRSLYYTMDVAANTFTIRSSSAVSADTSIGWLLVG